MNLKQILKDNHISQRRLSLEADCSPALITQLIKHGKYPVSVSKEAFQNSIETALEALNVTQKVMWQTEQTKLDDTQTEQELPDMKALTQTAKQLFNLPKSPFVDDVQCRDDVYISAEQRYIRQSMLSTAKHAGFMAVVGESGAGKTTLKRDLIEGVKRDKDCIVIIQPQTIDKTRLSVIHVCDAIIDDISGGYERPKRSMEAKARQIKRLLTNSSRAGNNHCLVIDEAHDLSVPVLKYLKRFWELEDGMKRLLAILLIGQPELKNKLKEGNADAREVTWRCELVELQPLNAYVGDYLKHKLNRAGINYDSIFSDDAMGGLTARLTQNTGNATASLLYPLIVNNTITSAMNFCAEIGQNKITADVFEQI